MVFPRIKPVIERKVLTNNTTTIHGHRRFKVHLMGENDDEEDYPAPLYRGNKDLVFTTEDEEIMQNPTSHLQCVPFKNERMIVNKSNLPQRASFANPPPTPEPLQITSRYRLMADSSDHSAPIKVCVLCHIGNIIVFGDMVRAYPAFFDGSIDIILSCSSQEIREQASNMMVGKIKHVIVTNNHGCDIGGFLRMFQYIKRNRNVLPEYDLFFLMHTKTDKVWRNGMLQPLHSFLLNIRQQQEKDDKMWIRHSSPLIFSGQQYIRKNYKLVNRNNVKEILRRNFAPSLVRKLDEYVDHYQPKEFFANTTDANTFQGLQMNPVFYRFYEEDVGTLAHWENHGRNEFHRISNYHYVKRFSRQNSNFVAGTCFAFNSEYMNVLMMINLESEFQKLEDRYVKNIVPRRIHAWEYLFGVLAYLYEGDIIITETSRAVYSWRALEPRSLINRPFCESKIAFMLLPPLEPPVCGGYKTLLRYIRYLNELGYSVDIYLGVAWNDNDLHSNVSCNAYYGEPMCRNWFHQPLTSYINTLNAYKIIDLRKNNVYVGLRLNRNYAVVVGNAWQVSHAAVFNEKKVQKMAYILQDREELFYPGNTLMQRRVLDTLRPQFRYFCLSKYLTTFFRKKLPYVEGTVLTYDPSVYQDQQRIRRDSVAIAYYAYKSGRLPHLMRSVIEALVSQRIECHVFPDRYESSSEYVKNHGVMSEEELNRLYNTCKVGIVFSNTNPSRLGFEMCGSGLWVIEYDCVYTKEDCVSPHFTLIKDVVSIVPIVRNLFKKGRANVLKGHQSHVERRDLQNFFRTLLSGA